MTKVGKTHIEVIQANLNKAHAAQIELLNKINDTDSYIAFITEPYCYKRQLSMLPKNCNYLPQIKTGHPIGWSKISWKMTLGKHFDLNMADMKKFMKYKKNTLNKLDK